MPLPFFAAQNHIPIQTANLVLRSRLLTKFDTSCLNSNVQVIFVAAPAGAGKTTLLAQWLGHLPGDMNAGWLSRNKGDDSLTRFLAYHFASFPGINMDLATQAESNPTTNAEQGMTSLAILVACILLIQKHIFTQKIPF